MKKSIAHAVSKGLVLAALSQAALADGVEYEVQWDEATNYYRVYMRPDATPVIDQTTTVQVTLRIPDGMISDSLEGNPSALSNAIDLTSAHAEQGITWSASSGAFSPTEDPMVDYISFTPTLPAVFGLVGGEQQEIFSFTTGDACLGAVEIMDNDNDPFNNPPAGQQFNSRQSNPGNAFTSLGWGSGNQFLGIEGGAAVCRSLSANNDPVVVDDSGAVEQGESTTIAVLDNDSDADGDALTITAKTDGDHGVAAIVNGTMMTYTAADNSYFGPDSFTYTVSDGKGGTITATVSINITEKQATGNNPPVAVSDTISVVAGASVDIDVVDNDTDADGDSLTLATVGVAGKGVASISGGQVRYTADAGESGPDSFTYTVSDGQGGETTGTVTVNITMATASDNDGDGLSNDDEAILGTNPDEADSDGDGIDDRYEVGPNVSSSAIDTDRDGIIDALDPDDDNDGILTRFENYNGGLPTDDDTDRDGRPDYLDPDDDNDGLLTAQEAPDENGDGDPSDAKDSDPRDGIADYLQRPGNFSPEYQKPIPTLTEWAQILLTMLLGVVALGGFRRKYPGK